MHGPCTADTLRIHCRGSAHAHAMHMRTQCIATPHHSPLLHRRRGELRSYLNRFLEHNACCAEFGLVRDPSRWGVPHATAEGTPLLLFAVRPPWVPNEPLAGERQRVAAAAAAARASRSRPEGEHEQLSAPA
eukprot:scaffold67635_cov72-Phaeocystis_antarctica.AAC.2